MLSVSELNKKILIIKYLNRLELLMRRKHENGSEQEL